MTDIPQVTCPAGICEKQAVLFDHDRMFGHLLVDHHWTFDTAQSWVTDNMASGDESRELEERYLSTGSDC